MDGRCSELNESQRENRCPGFRGRGESAVYKKWESEKLWGQNRGSSKSARECVVGGKGNPGNSTCPGDTRGSYLVPYHGDAVWNAGGLRLASALSWVKLRHKTRKTAGAGNRSNLWEISPWAQEITEGE